MTEFSSARFDDAVRSGKHIWTTLGYRRVDWRQGGTTIEWDATEAYGFPTAGGTIIQGGLVTAVLDAAMGGAAWTVLSPEEAFLTADLRVEFLRATRPGTVSAVGSVVKRTSRVVFCAADLFDADLRLLAASRCTQVVLPSGAAAGRYGPATADGAPPQDARG